MSEILSTPVNNWHLIAANNISGGAFPSLVPQVAEPVGPGVIDLATVFSGKLFTVNSLRFIFFGSGIDNGTFSVRVTSWRQRAGSLWIPNTLIEAACTLSGVVGVAGQKPLDTDRLVDTIVSTTAGSQLTPNIYSAADDLQIAEMMVDILGSPKVQVAFKIGTATDANGFFTGL